MPAKSTMSVEARFWSKVDATAGPDGCWLWTEARDDKGYGRFTVHHTDHRLAHRMAYELAHGPIPHGLYICHHCDNPPCCNPAHLFAGSQSDNMRDAVRKGRLVNMAKLRPELMARGEQHGSVTHPERFRKGEQHGGAKLTESQVLEIRRLSETGTLSSMAIARLFNISDTTIRQIIKRERWKHI